MNKKIDTNGFMNWFEKNYNTDSLAKNMVLNILEYAEKCVAKDEFADFISAIIPEAEKEEINKFFYNLSEEKIRKKYALIEVIEREISMKVFSVYEDAQAEMEKCLREVIGAEPDDDLSEYEFYEEDFEIGEYSAWANTNNPGNCDWCIISLEDIYTQNNAVYHKLISEIRKLNDNTPDGVIQDADTILADIVEMGTKEALMQETGISEELFQVWEAAEDKSTFEEMFFLFTNTSFCNYLNQCIEKTSRP